MSSIRTTAESIARRGIPYSWLNDEDEYKSALNWFANEIEEALRNERERAAKIAETIPESGFDLDHEPAPTEQQIRNGIARLIRAQE